jgi:hypothetical protein
MTIATDEHGSPPVNPNGNLYKAMGNVNLSLALVTGLATDATGNVVGDTVTLYNPSTLTPQGAIVLGDVNPLSDLSGTFYPNLGGQASPKTNVALVNVLGNTQSFRANDTQGLVFNGEGNVNLVKIQTANDTTIIGLPFGHAEIPHRFGDTTVLSSTRIVNGRNGVTDNPAAVATGPLSLP